MSQSDTSTRPALGSRKNFWGDPEPDPDSESELDGADTTSDSDAQSHNIKPGTSYTEWVAYTLLKSHPETDVLCGRCMYEENANVPLSEPEHYVERSLVERDDGTLRLQYGDHRKHRHCPKCSEVSFGGPLSHLDTESFMEVVDDLLDALDNVGATQRERLRSDARDRKENGDDDMDVLEAVVDDLEPGRNFSINE